MNQSADHTSDLQNSETPQLSIQMRLILFSLILFIIALGFNVLFTSVSLDRLYIDSMISEYRVAAMALQQRLESGLRYGKKLHNFYGLERLADKTSNDITTIANRDNPYTTDSEVRFSTSDIGMVIASADGSILYNNNTTLPLSKNIGSTNASAESPGSKTSYTKFQNTYVATIDIHDPAQTRVGTINLIFEEKKVNAFLKAVFHHNLKVIAWVVSGGILTLILLISSLTRKHTASKRWPKRKVSFVIFMVISAAQIIICIFFTRDYNTYFFQVNRENATTINYLLAKDVAFIKSHGVKIDQLIGFELYLKRTMQISPEIKDITFFDRSHQPLYRATKEQVTDFKRSQTAYDQWVEAVKPLSNPEFNVKTEACTGTDNCGYFSANVSKDIFSEKVIDIALDSLTIIIISILFFVEIFILISYYFELQVQSVKQQVSMHYGLMRPAAFLFLFGIDLSMSFLPLHMENLYEPTLGLSKDTVMGLPISVEFFFVGIAILISGIWLDKRGWHQPFISGLFLTIAGILYSWLAPDAIHFILSRAVVGLGYGLSLMASQGFVIHYSDNSSKAQGLAHLFAGIYAGSICGSATGAIMAEWLGYTPVFLAGALIIILVVGYTLLFMRQGLRQPEPATAPLRQKAEARSKSLLNFLSNRSIIGLILFSSMPAAIVVIGFLNYFSPIYLKRIGASQSTIGQILMLYGICLIYFGPFISRYVDASRNKQLYIFAGCLLGASSLLIFMILDGMAAAVTAVLLLGFSSSLVLASQSAYALKLNVTRELGEGKAIAIFRSSSRIGQMLGPIVFSTVIIATNSETGITYLGMAYLVMAVLFIMITQTDKKTVILDDA